jgi:hypothetical protein
MSVCRINYLFIKPEISLPKNWVVTDGFLGFVDSRVVFLVGCLVF